MADQSEKTPTLNDVEIALLLSNVRKLAADEHLHSVANLARHFIEPQVTSIVEELRAARARLAEVEASDTAIRYAIRTLEQVRDALACAPGEANKIDEHLAALERLKTKGTR